MAIEDATVLAECLFRANDVPAALKQYETDGASGSRTSRQRPRRLAALSRRGYDWPRRAMASLAGEKLILSRND